MTDCGAVALAAAEAAPIESKAAVRRRRNSFFMGEEG
jgi:hypothetical protein